MINAKKRGVTTAITALFAMTLAAAVAGRGCQDSSDGPTDAVRAFQEAAATDNREVLFAMLCPQTQKSLERAAVDATKLVGGDKRFSAQDMLHPLAAGPNSVSIVNLGTVGDRATIRMTDSNGKASNVETMRIDGAWCLLL